MKVCMVSYSHYYDSRVYRYALSLLERGDSVDMICLGDGKHFSPMRWNNITVYGVQTRKFNEKSAFSYFRKIMKFFLLSTFTCTKLYFKKRYDLIHFHNIPDFGVFCTLIPKFMGAKVILDIHDIVPEFYMRKFSIGENHIVVKLLKLVEKMSAHYADHVITVTDIWREKLIERSVSASKCTVILNAPHPSLFHKNKSLKKLKGNSFMLSYHGNLAEPTGVDILIKAMKIVKESAPSIRLQIIGDGRDREKLMKLTETLGLLENVEFIKTVPSDKIAEFLQRADVGIDPKRDGIYAGETLSVKAMEYLIMKIPLVVSGTKAAKSYFDESMVIFFEPGNEVELAKAILTLYKSPEKRKRLSENGEKFNNNHSWEKYKRVYYNLIDNLCSNK